MPNAECLVAHREHGWTGDPEHCPALSAEDLMYKAENLLLESLEKLTGAGFYGSLELRKKALDLALGVCTVEPK